MGSLYIPVVVFALKGKHPIPITRNVFLRTIKDWPCQLQVGKKLPKEASFCRWWWLDIHYRILTSWCWRHVYNRHFSWGRTGMNMINRMGCGPNSWGKPYELKFGTLLIIGPLKHQFIGDFRLPCLTYSCFRKLIEHVHVLNPICLLSQLNGISRSYQPWCSICRSIFAQRSDWWQTKNHHDPFLLWFLGQS